ncbi:hypothetical protein ARMSODRAFT_967964 [Armillaria solidipes]|uniref:Uncharacterized protein n=1 Tax=Armillaria solidipes TaxID=1076256 RepID=A0A2H3CEG4_9AGAR|nr:hypothetical protein ARMSODRAFT_967964 [Armillaria solidipes]
MSVVRPTVGADNASSLFGWKSIKVSITNASKQYHVIALRMRGIGSIINQSCVETGFREKGTETTSVRIGNSQYGGTAVYEAQSNDSAIGEGQTLKDHHPHDPLCPGVADQPEERSNRLRTYLTGTNERCCHIKMAIGAAGKTTSNWIIKIPEVHSMMEGLRLEMSPEIHKCRALLMGVAAQDDFLSWKYCLRRYSSITDAIMLAKVT